MSNNQSLASRLLSGITHVCQDVKNEWDDITGSNNQHYGSVQSDNSATQYQGNTYYN